MKNVLLSFALLVAVNGLSAQNILVPVDAGSKVRFVIKNFALNTSGDFTGLKGAIQFDTGNIAHAAFNITVASASVNTGNNKRDGHLKKPDYFDVATYPTLHMLSSKIEKGTQAGTYTFTGSLTIKGVARPITFPFTADKSTGGYLFTGSFDINRRDFNVGGGAFSMGDNVKVSLSVLAK